MKPSKERRRDALDFVHDLLAEEDADALAELTPDARHAEMRAQGLDPSRARALLERILAEREQILAEREHLEEHERIATERPPASAEPERAAPVRVVQASDVVEALPRRRAPWLALAIAASIAMAAGAVARPAIVAWLAPKPPVPTPSLPVPAPPSPSPEQMAADLRRNALTACAEQDFAACESGLDRAKEIDPAGEGDVHIKEARDAIREAKTPPREIGDKPRLK